MAPNVRLRHKLRTSSLWLVPMLCLLLAVALASLTLTLDSIVGDNLLPASVLGNAGAVQTILSTAASAMLTLTTIVLTVMTLGMQFAMQQFSPRIVRALLADRSSQLAHGLFAATFLYSMIAVSRVDAQSSGSGRIPSITVLLAYLLLLSSLVALVLYVHHAGQSLRVAGLIDIVGDRLRVEIDQKFPPISKSASQDHQAVCADCPGALVAVEVEELVHLAERADTVFEVRPAIGDFVPQGGELVRSHGGPIPNTDDVRRLFVLDNERSHVGDPAYGFRKLVDIAERSVGSNPFQDPTTAVQAIDRIHDCLRQLAGRPIPPGRHCDAGGTTRLLTRELTWDGYVHLAFDEIRIAGAESPQVARRLAAALDDLIATAPPARRPVLQAQRDRLDQAHSTGGIIVSDLQGLGSGTDVSCLPEPTVDEPDPK